MRRLHPGLVLPGLVCAAMLTASVRLTAENDGMTVLGKVTALPVGDVLRHPPNFFDLEGKTVTFTPDGEGRYAVQTTGLTWVETSTRVILDFQAPAIEPAGLFHDISSHAPAARSSRGESTGVGLPFGFPFAGRTWTRVHANTNGNVSFTASERTLWEQRDPWADGAMRSVAAAVDSRSAAGLEAMIAVLWAIYGEAAVSVASSPERVAITWEAVRTVSGSGHGYEPAGPNAFQVRLYPSGAIEFAYRQVSERDGIVGLFHGSDARGRTLSTVEDAVGDVANATVDIISVELVDNGSTVVASVTMAADIPARVSSGTVEYRVFLDSDGKRCAVGLAVDTTARRELSSCGPEPSVVGYKVQDATIEIPFSKTLLNDARTFSWSMDAVWWGRDVFDGLDGSERVSLDEWGHDLSSRTETVAGNVFEVFHYPSIHTNTNGVLPYIYEQAPSDDELAVLFTDFRYDDLFSTGPASGPINVPIQGIGDWQANPRSGSTHGSDSLLSAFSMRYIGGPKYAESVVRDGYEFRDQANGVRDAGHELIHRWAAHLRFRNPRSGRIEHLTDDWCRCHWSEWLHVPARYPVWNGFSNRSYPEVSVMGGNVWQDNGDGTFTRQNTGDPVRGLSDLDLYVMGMIPPEEVRPTFLLRDVVETSTWGMVRATKVPVRIEDIVAAMGPRVPSASEQRKVFRMGVYLLHEDRRTPRPEWLARAQSFTDSLAKYFTLATGGGVDANRPPTAAETLPDQVLPLPGALDVDVSRAFTDPDGDRLAYTVSSSAAGVATARAAGARVTLTAVSAGTATIRVTATDPGGLRATQSFTVTVLPAGASAPFTDAVLRPGVTPVRAVHFMELRQRIDALRTARGLGRFRWTDPALRVGVTPVRLVHLLELRSALAAAYTAAGRPVPRWTDPAPVRGTTPIRAAHLMELRAAVVALE